MRQWDITASNENEKVLIFVNNVPYGIVNTRTTVRSIRI